MTSAANFQSLRMATSAFCFCKWLTITRTSSKSLASSPEVEEGAPWLFMVPLEDWGSLELRLSSMLVRLLGGMSEVHFESACSSPGRFICKNQAHQLSRKTRVFENRRSDKNTSCYIKKSAFAFTQTTQVGTKTIENLFNSENQSHCHSISICEQSSTKICTYLQLMCFSSECSWCQITKVGSVIMKLYYIIIYNNEIEISLTHPFRHLLPMRIVMMKL